MITMPCTCAMSMEDTSSMKWFGPSLSTTLQRSPAAPQIYFFTDSQMAFDLPFPLAGFSSTRRCRGLDCPVQQLACWMQRCASTASSGLSNSIQGVCANDRCSSPFVSTNGMCTTCSAQPVLKAPNTSAVRSNRGIVFCFSMELWQKGQHPSCTSTSSAEAVNSRSPVSVKTNSPTPVGVLTGFPKPLIILPTGLRLPRFFANGMDSEH
mmetsp:Transcript_40618/g.72980  ORF Transcript_40618/g.72980 Transcript_40618/m.72980 type:complete len:209 (+) Transcript_40618:1289-1915(+)